jgi:hypothetical protein
MGGSWWDLGEGRGQHGGELELFRITCPFCMERGNFHTEHAATKKKANSQKVLHFDTLKCGNCAGYVMVLWSAGGRLYDYHVLPWPAKLDAYPSHWPERIGRFWLQAHRTSNDENWDAAAVMARSALQSALRLHGAEGNGLYGEIADLATKGVLPPHMKDWAHELRQLGNESAHPDPSSAEAATPDDVRDVIKFLDFLLQYLFDLPHEIAEYRNRKETP